MSKSMYAINCPICDKQTLPNYCSEECYYRDLERHRIIKLLERLWEKTQGTDLPAVVVLPDAIALIKGENK